MNCTLWCASYLLGVSPDKLIDEIGHDGTEVCWPEYDDCRKYRGFSIAEVQDCFINRGKILAPIFVYPSIAPGYDARAKYLWTHEHAEKRMFNLMQDRLSLINGVLKSGIGHAVCFNSGMFVDPRDRGLHESIDDYSIQEVYLVCKIT